MSLLKWVFPTGAMLTVGGVFLSALMEHHGYESTTQDWEFEILFQTSLPALLLGAVLTIVGSFIDKWRLPATQVKARGIICLIVSGVSFGLLATTGNVHGWTFTFFFPAFVGFIAAGVLLI